MIENNMNATWWRIVWLDWFKGKFTGKPHDLHGKIYGFRLRFSPTNQSIDCGWISVIFFFPSGWWFHFFISLPNTHLKMMIPIPTWCLVAEDAGTTPSFPWFFDQSLANDFRVCLKMSAKPLNLMVLLIIIPTKWLFHWWFGPHFQTYPYINHIFPYISIYFPYINHIKRAFQGQRLSHSRNHYGLGS